MKASEAIKTIGAHVPFKASAVNLAYDLGFRSFQFFIGSPQTDIDDYVRVLPKYMEERRQMPDDVTYVVHGLYWYNFVKGNWLTEKTLNSMKNQLAMCKHLGVHHYVTHIGYRANQKELDEGTDVPHDFAIQNWMRSTIKLIPLLEKADVKLCYENTSGNKARTSMGKVDDILRVVTAINDYDRVGYTFDTQHAFAYGESMFWKNKEIFFDDVVLRASVIHLNGNEAGVEFGSYRDRHSKTLTVESKNLSTSRLLRVLEMAKGPVILERDNLEFLSEDLRTLREHIKQVENASP